MTTPINDIEGLRKAWPERLFDFFPLVGSRRVAIETPLGDGRYIVEVAWTEADAARALAVALVAAGYPAQP